MLISPAIYYTIRHFIRFFFFLPVCCARLLTAPPIIFLITLCYALIRYASYAMLLLMRRAASPLDMAPAL